MHNYYKLLIISLFFILNSCLDKELFTFYKPYFPNSFKTKDKKDLSVEALPDTIHIKNQIPQIGAYYAIVKGEFTHILDTIVQWGHVWGYDEDTLPVIKKDDTTNYTVNKGIVFDTIFKFYSYLNFSYPETKFNVRSYVITSKGDTGYNPLVLKAISLPPINEWFYNDKGGTTLSPREGACIFTVNFRGDYKIFLACGNDASGTKGDIYEFNKSKMKWEQRANYSDLKRTECVGFAIVEKNPYNGQEELYLYIGLGKDDFGNPLNDFYRIPYNNFESKIKLEYNFPYAVSSAISFTINNIAYVGLGKLSDNVYFQEIYLYNYNLRQKGQNPWVKVSQSLPVGRENACVTTYQNVAFIGLGNDNNNYYKDFYMFFPPKNTLNGLGASIIPLPEFPSVERTEAVCFELDNYIYIGLGRNGNTYFSDMYRYNPYYYTWEITQNIAPFKHGPDWEPTMDNKIKNAAAFSLIIKEGLAHKKMGFVVSGRQSNGNYSDSTWYYRPW